MKSTSLAPRHWPFSVDAEGDMRSEHPVELVMVA